MPLRGSEKKIPLKVPAGHINLPLYLIGSKPIYSLAGACTAGVGAGNGCDGVGN